MHVVSRVLAASLLWLAPLVATADSFRVSGLVYNDVRFVSFADGKVLVEMSRGTTFSKPIGELEAIAIKGAPAMARAEELMASGRQGGPDYGAAATEYGKALSQSTDGRVRLIIQARSISALDQAGRWLDAVKAFVAVLEASPTTKTFALRPRNFATCKGKDLSEAADLVIAHASRATSNDAKRLLNGFALEIYLALDDPRAATLAGALGSFGGEIRRSHYFHELDEAFAADGELRIIDEIEDIVLAGHAGEALERIDSALPTASDGTAVHLFALKAQILQNQGKSMDAAAAYLRIAAHYPEREASSAEALWRAAGLLDQLHHNREAQRLYREIIRRYSTSPRAEDARRQLPAASSN